jgi:hypothetical protein
VADLIQQRFPRLQKVCEPLFNLLQLGGNEQERGVSSGCGGISFARL